MKYIATIILFLTVEVSIAQTMYKDSIFNKINITTYNYDIHNKDTLKFDFYKAEKAKGLQPLLVFVHGGGFTVGVRDDVNAINFATNLAQRGYAVASVSYRLTMKDIGFGCNVAANKKIAAIDAASFDVSLAIKYMLDNDEEFLVDKNKIILAGSSAGAEAVLNMAYVYENKILPSNFNFAGVISFAGAVTTLDKINENTAIPTQLFHGTADELVPYSNAPHRYCNSNDKGYLMLYGSQSIAEHLKDLGVTYYFYSINEGTHRWAGLPMTKYYNDVIIDFLYHDVIKINAIRQTDRIINNI